MEQIDTEVSKTNSFLSHMFSFDNDTKSELLNVGQYALISIIPLIALVKLIDSFLPNFDPTKSNIELSGEILVHVVLLIAAVFFVDRLVKFVPTYSGKGHKSINFLNIIIMFYLTTDKIGEKLSELSSRVNDLWNGQLKPVEKMDNKKESNNVKVTQPIKQIQQAAPTHQASRADYLTTHKQMSATENVQNEVTNEQQHSGASNDIYNSMGYNQPNIIEPMEPLAANDALGGFTSF
tara:strand:- start:62 stop:769 length:708 start_codon:yes stop_codon:yes gene_type:complete